MSDDPLDGALDFSEPPPSPPFEDLGVTCPPDDGYRGQDRSAFASVEDVPPPEPPEAPSAAPAQTPELLPPADDSPVVQQIVGSMELLSTRDLAQVGVLLIRYRTLPNIVNDATCAAADALRADMEAVIKDRQLRLGKWVAWADRLHKRLLDVLRLATGELSEPVTALAAAIGAYRRRAREEREREEREAAERRRAEEVARLEAAAGIAAARGTEEAALEVAALQQAAAATPLRVTRETGPKGYRTTWYAEVLNPREIKLHVAKQLLAGDFSLEELLSIDGGAANNLARAQKTNLAIPGLRAVSSDTATRSRRRE